MANPIEPDYYRSFEYLESLIKSVAELNETMPRPPGGQQVGLDRSWNHPGNTFGRKRELAWYCREMLITIKYLKKDINARN